MYVQLAPPLALKVQRGSSSSSEVEYNSDMSSGQLTHKVFEEKLVQYSSFAQIEVICNEFESDHCLSKYLHAHRPKPDEANKFWTRLDRKMNNKTPLTVLIKGSMFIVDDSGNFSPADLELQVERDVILIVGDPIGLERELALDVAFACKRTGLDDSVTLGIVSMVCRDGGLVENCVYRCIDNRGRFQLISNPSTSYFPWLFVAAISRVTAKLSLEIIYCGHGGDDGTIAFHDGDFALEEFSRLFQEHKLNHYPQASLLLNCCYASSLVQEFQFQGSSQEPNGDYVLDSMVNGMRLQWPGIDKLAETFKSGSLTNVDYQRVQTDIVRSMLWLHDATGGRSLTPFKWGGNSLNVWPLSFGRQRAEGYLREYCGLGITSSIDPRHIYRETPSWFTDPVKLASKMPVPTPDETIPESRYCVPRVTVFQAGNGDSCLFEWQGVRILIDGGGTSWSRTTAFTPCYWEKVKHLSEISVILTHGDMDHIGGLLPLFARPVKTSPRISCALFTAPAESDRCWRHVKLLAKHADDAKINVVENMRAGYYCDLDPKVNVFCLLPTADGLKEAQEIVHGAEKFRFLTPINKLGQVIILECTLSSKVWRLLFTGDACGKDVADSLEKNKDHMGTKWSSYTFDYVDMPHHGSKENEPAAFLSKLKAQHLIVSTDGSRHRHPDHDTCNELLNWMKKNVDAKLFFNYKDHMLGSGTQRKVSVQSYFDVAGVKERVIFPADNSTPVEIILQ